MTANYGNRHLNMCVYIRIDVCVSVDMYIYIYICLYILPQDLFAEVAHGPLAEVQLAQIRHSRHASDLARSSKNACRQGTYILSCHNEETLLSGVYIHIYIYIHRCIYLSVHTYIRT